MVAETGKKISILLAFGWLPEKHGTYRIKANGYQVLERFILAVCRR